MYRFTSRVLGIVCALFICLVFTDSASAAVRPHSSSGTAQFTGPNTFIGAGQATHLGRYTETGTVAFSPTKDPAVLHVEGTLIYTASNGDELHAVVSGQLNGATGAISASVQYVGGTGRFAKASGSAALTGQVQLDGTLAVSVSGDIDY